MVGDKESFLPPHEHSPPIAIRHGQMRSPQFVLDMPKCWEALPMNHVFLFVCSPLLGQKAIAAADYLCVKVGRQLGPVVGQSAYAEVPAEEGRGKVDILGHMSARWEG